MHITVIDYETSRAPRHLPWVDGSFVVMLGVVTSGGYKKVYVFQHRELSYPPLPRPMVDEVQEIIDESDIIVAHNLKFEMLWNRVLGLDLFDKRIWCTLVAEYLLNGQFGDFPGGKRKGLLTLDTVAQRYDLPHKLDKVAEYWDQGYETDEIPLDILGEYCLHDCDLALEIFLKQWTRQGNMGKLMRVEMESIKALADIEWNGMLVDPQKLREYSDQYAEEIEQTEKELTEVSGHSINWGSNKQLSALLYGGEYLEEGVEQTVRMKGGRIKEVERKVKIPVSLPGLGFKVGKLAETKKDGVYKTDQDTLSSLKPRTKQQKRVLELLKSWSEKTRQKSTYFDGLLERVQPDGRVHPSMNQTVTGTGRLSSSNPNGQNFSRGTTSPVKKAFITRYKTRYQGGTRNDTGS